MKLYGALMSLLAAGRRQRPCTTILCAINADQHTALLQLLKLPFCIGQQGLDLCLKACDVS